MNEVKMAMTQNFVRVATDKEWDYLKHKEFEDLPITLADEVENFAVSIFNGYHGYTLAFRTKSIYDLYRVYDHEWKLILETEDEVVEMPSWFMPSQMMRVEAFEKAEDRLIRRWQFDSFELLPDRNKTRGYKLSVVVPLYNSELFMCRTIDSILSSSLDSIELILVDDWSKDKSYEIAQRYADNYKCVKIVHQENKWVSFARNLWLEMCKWKYMAFCDNDDIIHPLMYEILYDTCEKEWTDIAIAQTLIRKDIEEKEFYLTCSARKEDIVVYSFDELFKNRWTKGNIFWVAVWNKIVKTDIAKLAQFPTDYTWPWILYEDVAYTSSLYSYIDKFAYNRNAIYTWDKRKQKTVWTASTWHQKEDNEYVWRMFIYGFSRALYHKSWKHLEWHDFTHFKRLIESYDKFDTPSTLRFYWDIALRDIITSQKLNENKLIMWDKHLKEIVDRFI